MEKQLTLFKIRDLRKKDQFKIDDKYLNGYARICGVNATLVYNSLCRHSEFHTQKAFPSQGRIAHQHGISVKRVRVGIKKLIEYNIISAERRRVEGKFTNYVYYLLDKSVWKESGIHQFVKKELPKEHCLLCGSEMVDRCHILPRKEGGRFTKDNVVYLCPTHHRMFDRGLLNKEQKDQINDYHRTKQTYGKAPQDINHLWSTTGGKRTTKDNKQQRITNNKDNKERETKISPAEEMKLFLDEKEYFTKVCNSIVEKSQIDASLVLRELYNFKSYWSELNRSGKKQRWELERTFELKRRLGTWFRNADKFSKQKGKNIIFAN